jgi:hypothetical protein
MALRNYEVIEMYQNGFGYGNSISIIEENLSDNSKVYGISIMTDDQHIIIDCATKKNAENLFNSLKENAYGF